MGQKGVQQMKEVLFGMEYRVVLMSAKCVVGTVTRATIGQTWAQFLGRRRIRKQRENVVANKLSGRK